jgi:hypothetical protein
MDNKHAGKERVQKTLRFIDAYGFINDANLLQGKLMYYKLIAEYIYAVFYYFNLKSKNYNQHCFDLFISNSRNLDELKAELCFGKFRIASFDIDSTHHYNIFKYLMSDEKKDSFDILDKKLCTMNKEYV